MNAFRFGATSLNRMDGVRPELTAGAHFVIARMELCDITVPRFGGLRNDDQQLDLVQQGRSKTMDSDHLYGYALDLTPYILGRPRWDFDDDQRLTAPCPISGARTVGQLTKAGYQEIWKLMRQFQREYGYTFKRRLSWDWPHHAMRRPI